MSKTAVTDPVRVLEPRATLTASGANRCCMLVARRAKRTVCVHQQKPFSALACTVSVGRPWQADRSLAERGTIHPVGAARMLPRAPFLSGLCR